MLREVLHKLEDEQRDKLNIWDQAEIKKTLLTFIGLFPCVAFWYFWMLAAINGQLEKGKQDVWLDFIDIHAAIFTGLIVLLVFVSRFSIRARASNKIGLLAAGLLGCGLIVVFIPKGYEPFALLSLALTTLVYWLTPWRRIRGQWQEVSRKPETYMALSMQISERITKLPYNSIRFKFIELLDELLELDEEIGAIIGENDVSFSGFLKDFSVHYAPLIAALSYRAKLLGNDAPGLMAFVAKYPPFEPSKRAEFNSPAHYLNTVIHNKDVSPEVKQVWLKSGLIVADLDQRARADTLFDLELLLIPLLIKVPEQDQDEILLLVRRFMMRSNKQECTLNVFQCNSWLKLIEDIAYDPRVFSSVVHALVKFDNTWPGHRKNYIETAHNYSADREQRLIKAFERIKEFTEAHPEEDSFDLALDEKVGSLDCNEQAKAQCHQDFLELIEGSDVLYANFIQFMPQALLANYLNFCDAKIKASFLSKHQEVLGSEFNSNLFEEGGEQSDLSGSTLIFQQILRHHEAFKQCIGIQVKEIIELESISYSRDTQRYEYHVESLMNQAVLSRTDKTSSLLKKHLKELREDIESQNLDLAPFINHLGYKFGALIYAINQCFPDDEFKWLLDTAQNEESIIMSEQVTDNFLLRIMLNNIQFHDAIAKGDSQAAFDAIEQLFLLFIVRYPMNQDAAEATLVTGIEMISTVQLSPASIQNWVGNLITVLPMVYSKVVPNMEDRLADITLQAIDKYGLMQNPSVTNQQLEGLRSILPSTSAVTAKH